MTVDWTPWMTLTPEQQAELWRRYRAIIKNESEEAYFTRYRAMNDAMARVGQERRWSR